MNITIDGLTALIVALSGVITALTILVTTIVNLVKINNVKDKVDHVEQGVAQVHVLVNQSSTDQSNYNTALISSLNDAGVAVPKDQSKGQ